MRLTPFGKILVGGAVVVLALICYMLFFTSDAEIVESTGEAYNPNQAITLSVEGLRYPLNPAQEKQFDRTANEVKDPCFFSPYAIPQTGGYPIKFTALLPPQYQQNPYYYKDPESGFEFIPAYYVQKGGRGLLDATLLAEEDTEVLPQCMAESGGLFLVGFPPGKIPSSRIVEVKGHVTWNNYALNPGSAEREISKENGLTSVVSAGSFEELSPLQVADPALQERVLNIAVQRGPGVVRINRIEYASYQTRLWIQLINKGAQTLPAWPGVQDSILLPPGGQELRPSGLEGDDTSENEALASINPEDPASKLLPAVDVPPKAAGFKEGYVVFPKVDPDQNLILQLPEFSAEPEALGFAHPIAVEIPKAPSSQEKQ